MLADTGQLVLMPPESPINENFWPIVATDLSPGSLEKRALIGFSQNCSGAGANNVRPQVNEHF